ncbi:hypothetical protein LLO_0513 [Legionella longbeachae NSW150]|uniref:Uncharacterized protein n=1 Tax=Legionella longbeachae serogroup 1 (strain NSW150) TaxID=661367 RepID=D3HPN1_LEGLN|nr:hypothetical protein LLO_0513 [Legionella longbeachae NSW150]
MSPYHCAATCFALLHIPGSLSAPIGATYKTATLLGKPGLIILLIIRYRLNPAYPPIRSYNWHRHFNKYNRINSSKYSLSPNQFALFFSVVFMRY